MANAALKLEKRLAIGGGKVKRLRREGYIPAVVYGKGIEPKHVQVKLSEFRDFLVKNGKHALFDTELEDLGSFTAMVKEVQFDTQKNSYVHIDFQKVSMDEKINVDVPIRVVGKEMLERNGGVVVHQLNEVTVECLPKDVPKHIDVDVSSLAVGHSLTAGELKLPEGVTLLTEPDDVILSVISGRSAADEAEEAEGGSPEDAEKAGSPEKE